MSNTISVSNISLQIEQHHLHELFSACGVCTVQQLYVQPNGTSKSCIVAFNNPDECKAATFLNGVPLGDKLIDVKLGDDNNDTTTTTTTTTTTQSNTYNNNTANNQSNANTIDNASQSNSSTVYVGNLSPIVDDAILLQYFSTVGPVVSVKFGSSDGTLNRYAFIEFRSVSSATIAKQLNGSILADRPMKISSANQSTKSSKPSSSVYNENMIVNNVNLSEVEKQRAEAAMQKVREAQARLAAKAAGLQSIATTPQSPTPAPSNYTTTSTIVPPQSTKTYSPNSVPAQVTHSASPVITHNRLDQSPPRDLRSPSPIRSHSRSHSANRGSYSRSPSPPPRYRSRERSGDRDRYNSYDRRYRRRASPEREYIRKGRNHGKSNQHDGMIWVCNVIQYKLNHTIYTTNHICVYSNI